MIELTVGVINTGDENSLRRCLNGLAPQMADQPVEVVVPYDSTMAGGIDVLRRDFPQMEFLNLGVIETHEPPETIGARHERFDRRAAAVLASAKGSIVSLVQDWGVPDPDWCAQVLSAHRSLPHAAIGGGVEHMGRGALNWAVYFQDFGRYQAPLPEGPTHFLTDVNVSYKRQALLPVQHLWRDRFNEVTINNALLQRGEVLWRNPRMIVRQDRGALSLGPLLLERFSWGRIFGAARAHAASARAHPDSRWVYVALGPVIPTILLWRISRRALSGGRNCGVFLNAFPALTVMVIAWCAGEFWGALTRRPSPVGTPSRVAEA